jgi:diaminopropionate ammonia-lyase
MEPVHYFLNTPTNQLPNSPTAKVLEESNAAAFHRSLPSYKPTPLVALPGLAKQYGVGAIYVKDESHRFGLNAFKGLGASYAIHTLLQEHPQFQTFCTATDGNHGRAVAWSARLAGRSARVFVPQGTSPARIAAIEQEGASVVETSGDYDQTCAIAEHQSREMGWQLVQDTAWEGYEYIPALIMAGYLTHFLELENSLHGLPHPEVDIVFLQAGVGSWAASAVWYYLNRYGRQRPRLVLVEPAASDGILASFKQGQRTPPTGNLQTIMAGLNCGIPSLSAWEILKTGTDAAMRVDDSFAMEAIRQLYHPKGEDPQLISGESGVGGLAGFLALMADPCYTPLRQALKVSQHSRLLFYSTEGATDPVNFHTIITA